MTTKSRSETVDLPVHLIPAYIVMLWDKGFMVKDIALVVERHHNTVRNHLRKAGRIGSYDRPGRPTDAEIAKLGVMNKGLRLPNRLRLAVRARCDGPRTKRG